MKLRKIVLPALVIALITALCVPALGATVVELPPESNLKNNDSQKGWLTDGVDGKESDFTADDFHNAKYLVLEYDNAVPDQFIWQGDGNSWGWAQTDGVTDVDGGAVEGRIVIDIAATALNYDGWLASSQMKIFLAYYNPDWDAMGITRAYLCDVHPDEIPAGVIDEPAADEPVAIEPISADIDDNNPFTGVSDLLLVSAAVLLLAAAGMAIMKRKAK